jgi:hypothetical protein
MAMTEYVHACSKQAVCTGKKAMKAPAKKFKMVLPPELAAE